MRRCIRCTQWKDESEFNIRDKERGYLQSVCRDCQQQDSRDRYTNNTNGVLEMNKQSRQKSKSLAKQFVFEYLSQNPCVDCGERDIEVLTFDHIRGEKKWNIADIIQHGYSVETIAAEIAKTDVTCFNCHMRREQKRRGSERFNSVDLRRE